MPPCMDSLTHIVLGAAIGEAMLGKKIGKKGILWGALAASLPDIDVLFVPPNFCHHFRSTGCVKFLDKET